MAYDTWEAARLISWSNKQAELGPLTEVELTEWIDSGVGLLQWADVWEEDGKEVKYIDFPTLISLRMICLLHFEMPCSKGIPLQDLTAVALKLRQESHIEWPFAKRRIWNICDSISSASPDTLEDDDFKNIKEEWKYDYWWLWERRHGPTAKANLEYGKDGIACAWLPAEDIKIDPQFVSGSPCLAGTRIPTWIFPGMVRSGDSIAEIADDYGIPIERVEKALAWERQLASVGI